MTQALCDSRCLLHYLWSIDCRLPSGHKQYQIHILKALEDGINNYLAARYKSLDQRSCLD